MGASRGNIKEFKVEGVTRLLGFNDEVVNRIMIRVRTKHGRKQETWIDVPDGAGTFAIGDTVTIEKVKPYRIVTPQKVGDEDEQHSDN